MKNLPKKKSNQSSMPRIWRGKDGCLYIQRKGHVFEYKRKVYRNGELCEISMWRATVMIDGKAYWTCSKEKSVVEKWLKNVLDIYGRKKVIEYAQREPPIRIKAKYEPPVRISGDNGK